MKRKKKKNKLNKNKKMMKREKKSIHTVNVINQRMGTNWYTTTTTKFLLILWHLACDCIFGIIFKFMEKKFTREIERNTHKKKRRTKEEECEKKNREAVERIKIVTPIGIHSQAVNFHILMSRIE